MALVFRDRGREFEKEVFSLLYHLNVVCWFPDKTPMINIHYYENGILYTGEAAGLQDVLWGFGMRYAVISGFCASQSGLLHLSEGSM